MPSDLPAELHAEVLAALYSDRARALQFNGELQALAKVRRDGVSKAWAARSQGHIDHVQGDYKSAGERYREASVLFDAEGMELEVGRTLLSGLQALIYQSAYDEAMAWAARAEAIFCRLGDVLRLARLDSNVGNILFRQDRPVEAMERYTRALEGFELAGEPRDIAAALSNMAVASINGGQFSQALGYYEKARAHCELHDLENLVARADYNIAYLYYLRGGYGEARKLYRMARERSRATGDRYHSALCDLDEAEMYLELNQTQEGEPMARRAADAFADMGMLYEQAKALVNLGVAASQRNDYRFSDKALLQARRLFVREKNPVWPALVDQLRAVVAFHERRFHRARRLSSRAWLVLTNTVTNSVPGRAAHCQILLARLWMLAGQADRARTIIREALEFAGSDPSPSLLFHAHLVQGEIHELQGRWEEALKAYEAARSQVEDLRGRVDTEDLRISILKDKLAVYEGLIALCLDSPIAGTAGSVTRALLLVQQAKSRSLADRLGVPANPEGWPVNDHTNVEELRRDLNWVYRQIELTALLGWAQNTDAARGLRERARGLEAQLLAVKMPSREKTPADGDTESAAAPDGISTMQESLRDGEMLLEYYEARGTLYLLLVSRSGVEAVRLGSFIPIRQLLKLVQFHLGKFRWGAERLGSPDAMSDHLGELYRRLIAPVEDRLTGYRHLIIAPHRTLHSLPFAALHDGQRALVDRFTLSSAPSAQVLSRCRNRKRKPCQGAVIMAVPDALAPRIEEEACAVAKTLPGSTLLLGADASFQAFNKMAPHTRILHLAAHGIFRKDNPMFSAVQLADSQLSRLDLNRMELSMDLLTLSACNTGSAIAVGGDELLGLVRGFLLAGARSLLVTLWEVNDTSTHDFMRSFYREVSRGAALADALRKAMLENRQLYPHPYYWAPFLLIGDPDAVSLK